MIADKSSSYDQPHEDVRACQPTQGCLFGNGNLGKLTGIMFYHVEKFQVPLRVVESASLFMHLMRQTACRN